MTTAVGIIIALLCAIGALIYGVQSIKWIWAADPGNPRMQEIAAAVQEGARAYLNQQYLTIAVVGVIVGAVILFALGAPSAVGFAIGAICLGYAAISACTFRFALMSAPPKQRMMG